MTIQKLKPSQLVENKGQLADRGLQSNPRQWTQTDIDKLKRSLTETPELFEARPVLAYPLHGADKYIVLGGNMRLTAARSLKLREIPTIVFPADTPVEKLREIVLKDNGSFGAWDYDELANKWDDLPLTEWGIPAWDTESVESEGGSMTETERLSSLEYDPLYYEPREKPNLRLSECVNLDKFNAKIAAINAMPLSDEQKETLRLFCYRFIQIDFEAVANYYFFNAGEDEKRAIERLRLVLVDDGSIGGFVEDNLLRVLDITTQAAIEYAEEEYC